MLTFKQFLVEGYRYKNVNISDIHPTDPSTDIEGDGKNTTINSIKSDLKSGKKLKHPIVISHVATCDDPYIKNYTDKKYYCLDGHHRLEAHKKLHLKQIRARIV